MSLSIINAKDCASLGDHWVNSTATFHSIQTSLAIATMDVTQILQSVWGLSALFLIVLVMLHSPKGDGIGGIGGQAQLFTSTKSAETTLNRVTWILSIVFMSLTIVLSAGWIAG